MFLKTYITIAVLIAVAFIFLAVLVDTSFETTDQSLFVNGADADARLLIAELSDAPRETWPDRVSNYQSFGFRSVLGIVDEVSNQWEASDQVDGVWFSGGAYDEWQIAKAIPRTSQYLIVGRIDDPATRDDLLEFFIPMGGIFLTLGLGMSFLARRIERSVRSIADAAANFREGTLSERIPLPRDKLFGSLAERLNTLAGHIQQRWREQQVIVGAVPHELRSPVARLRFALDMTRDIDDWEKMHAQIERIDEYVVSLESVIEDTLSLSRLQLTDQVEHEQIAVAEFLSDLVQDSNDDTWKMINVNVDTETTVTLTANRSLLRLAVTNLLTNAVRYADSSVDLTLSSREFSGVEIRVEDDGPGVKPDKTDLLFMPFSRLEDSRSRTSGGIGLGLALVSLIMKRHDGEVRYAPADNGGAAFTLWFAGASKRSERP